MAACNILIRNRGIAMAELDTGDRAPDFTLPRDGGDAIRSEDLAGRAYVLYFYPKDDTSGCTAEAIDFSALKAEFDKAGVAVIGVSPDSVKSHRKFKAKYGLAIDLASDETKDLLQAYGVWGEKSMYGRKYMGVERTTVLVGRDGKIARVWRKVKVPGHAAQVLEAARNL